VEIIFGSDVRDTIVVHDLSPAELEIGRVNFTTKELVDGTSTSKDLMLAMQHKEYTIGWPSI
jgi:hypothetical protein